MLVNEKIKLDTEFDTWFGVKTNGERVAITEVDLLEFTSLLANVEDENLRKIGKELFEKAKNDNYIEMHDGTKLVKNIQEALNNNLPEIAQDLFESAKLQNINNGFENPSPDTE